MADHGQVKPTGTSLLKLLWLLREERRQRRYLPSKPLKTFQKMWFEHIKQTNCPNLKYSPKVQLFTWQENSRGPRDILRMKPEDILRVEENLKVRKEEKSN